MLNYTDIYIYIYIYKELASPVSVVTIEFVPFNASLACN